MSEYGNNVEAQEHRSVQAADVQQVLHGAAILAARGSGEIVTVVASGTESRLIDKMGDLIDFYAGLPFEDQPEWGGFLAAVRWGMDRMTTNQRDELLAAALRGDPRANVLPIDQATGGAVTMHVDISGSWLEYDPSADVAAANDQDRIMPVVRPTRAELIIGGRNAENFFFGVNFIRQVDAARRKDAVHLIAGSTFHRIVDGPNDRTSDRVRAEGVEVMDMGGRPIFRTGDTLDLSGTRASGPNNPDDPEIAMAKTAVKSALLRVDVIRQRIPVDQL